MLSISHTTRSPRQGEVDGVNYFFRTKEEFQKSIEEKNKFTLQKQIDTSHLTVFGDENVCFDEIMHFFSVYKQLESKQTAVKTLFGPQEAQQIIKEAINSYQKKFVDKTEKI